MTLADRAAASPSPPGLRPRGGRLRRSRRGVAVFRLSAVSAVIAVAAAGVWWRWGSGRKSADETPPIVGPVTVGIFVHEIIERGDVQSSKNVEVRCEVQMRSSSGTAILEIVPEGTMVEEGDFLIRLDDSSLQNDLTLQQIDCNSSHASVIQTQTAVETAKLALEEYVSGTFKQAEEQLQSDIFVAEENFRRSEEYLKYSERLAAKGYVTPIQLEADRFAVEKARKELDVAETKIEVLRDYTKQKVMKQLEADVRTAEARLSAALEIDSVENAQLQKIQQQIAKCLIAAPTSGQVVYANDSPGRSGEDVILIEEGRFVRERQILIRLPNPQFMQVTAKINEARIDLVKPDMDVRVKVDALPETELRGRVRRVNEYPLQQASSYTAHIKEYATEIDILDPPSGLRPGMTAQAAIIVEQREQAMQVPVQSVIEREGRFYCLVQTEAEVEARQVQIGPTNDIFVVIETGLSGDEQVLMSPQQFAERVTLPPPVAYPPRSARPVVQKPAKSEAKVAAKRHGVAAKPHRRTAAAEPVLNAAGREAAPVQGTGL